MRSSRRAAGWIATTSTTVSFTAALVALIGLVGEDGAQRYHLSTAWTWLGAGSFHVGFSILLDPLSVFMMLIVSGVGTLIVAYSIGYMDGEARNGATSPTWRSSSFRCCCSCRAATC